MATASATATQTLRSTHEKENYQRLSRLIMCAGTELFRALFDFFYPPSSLGKKLSESATKQKLCNVLLKPQHDLVYPPSGLCGESRNFDISLLSKLLKVLCRTQLPQLPSGWDDPPSRDDLSLTADIVRVKFYRNDIIHKFPEGELRDTEFCSLWDGIKMALLRIASKISAETRLEWEEAIEKLRYDPLTPEAEKNAEELQKWYQKDMDTKESLERLKKEIQAQKNEIEQLRDVLMNRPSSSSAGGAPLRITIDFGSVTSRSSREEPPAMTESFHAQPTASAGKPIVISISNIEPSQRIALEIRRHIDQSTNEKNQFVQRLEVVIQAPIVNVDYGSLVLTVKCTSLEILERLWQDYSSGHLGEAAQEFLVTDKVLEDLGLVELILKITISEEDYRECRRHFTKCAGSDHLDEKEGEQKEDDREDEHIPSQHPTGNVNQVPIVNVDRGSLVLTVRCTSLETLERLWQDYSSGHLGEVAQEFLVTDKVLEDLGLVELKLKIAISEEDYRECRRHFTKCAGSDNSDEREGEQKEDVRKGNTYPLSIPQMAQKQDQRAETSTQIEESSPGDSPKPIEETFNSKGIRRNWSLLPHTVPHFVNRKTECQKIKDYLSPSHKCRCLVIHGATGIGKTTVAMKVANDIMNSDKRTVVIYVNCKDVKLSYDFASKAFQQVCDYPDVDDPVAELKNRLKSQDFHTILLLDNFEFLLHLDTNGLSLRQVDPSNEGSRIMSLINEILMFAGKVKLLLTSSERVSFPEGGQEELHLKPFKPEESVELLREVWKGGQINTTQAHDLSEICSGIPLVLYTLASCHKDLLSLLEEMKNTPPQEKFEFLKKIQTVSPDKKIDVCIDHCFRRLDWQAKCALISFALFRRRFSLSEVVKLFQSTEMRESELRKCGLELSRRSLLEENIIGDDCFYTLLPVIRDYCETKAMEQEFREVISNARKMFTHHFLTFLEDTFRKFLSKNVSKAIAAFQMDEGNVLQLVEWCSEGQIDEEQTERCIDVFNSVAELLAKMMGKAKFKDAFQYLRRRCEQRLDQKRLSNCLTSLGIEEVFRSACRPTGLGPSAAQIAKEYLTEADQIQCTLEINNGNSRAQCLSKLARCLAKEHNFDEAKEKVNQAIKIRSALGEEDIVMLGATYNDQAVILSLEDNHWLAIEVREKQTLPIYKERLGDHPFTATILNSLSNNYYALGKYDDAERYSKEALDIRQKLLKDHRDTAKSLFDLGMTHKMKEEFKPAMNYLERCEAMQKGILDENDNDLTRTRNELEDVKRRLADAEGQSRGFLRSLKSCTTL